VLEKERVNNLLEKLISTVVSAIAQLGCETNRVNWSIYSNFNIIMPDKTTKTAKITHIDSIGKLMFKVYPVNCVVCDFKKDDDIEFAAEKIVECIFETEPNVFKNYSKEH